MDPHVTKIFETESPECSLSICDGHFNLARIWALSCKTCKEPILLKLHFCSLFQGQKIIYLLAKKLSREVLQGHFRYPGAVIYIRKNKVAA